MNVSGISLGSITGVSAIVAAGDPTWPNIVTTGIAAIVTITTIVIGFKTLKLKAQLDRADQKLLKTEEKLVAHDIEIKEVIKTSDGMKTALVAATADANLAQGVLEGMKQAEAKAAVVAAAQASGRTQQGGGQGGPLAQPPPLLLSQKQPVAAEGVEGVELTPEQIEKMIAELSEQLHKLRLKPGVAQVESKPVGQQ